MLLVNKFADVVVCYSLIVCTIDPAIRLIFSCLRGYLGTMNRYSAVNNCRGNHQNGSFIVGSCGSVRYKEAKGNKFKYFYEAQVDKLVQSAFIN
ncbi:hypothetical protein BDFG_03711 [Blastomyces dermatitidis ATCC 26199]|nr:hypothetical protein BDFG_03711 [Blastomyces dermatitidis ATCC 26199]